MLDTDLDLSWRAAHEVSAGRFPSYYLRLLRAADLRARRELRPWEDEVASLDALLTESLQALQSRLDVLCVRTLITCYQGERAANPTLTYREFDQFLATADARDTLLDVYPELGRLEELTISHWVGELRDVLRAVRESRTNLAALGASGKVTSIRQGEGDGHCGGRSVMIVAFTSGTRLAVKPNPGGALPVARAVLNHLDPEGDFFGPVFPAALVCGGYEWQQAINPSSVRDIAEERRWALRAGRVSALAFALGATDLHRENIVATREGPVIIDTETLTSLPPTQPTGAAAETGAASMAGVIRADQETSPLRTMLHPARYLGAPIDIDLSAYGGATQVGQSSATLPVLRVVDEGMDTIRFENRPTGQQSALNVLHDATGATVDMRRYVPELVEGYRQGVALIRANADLVDRALADVRPGQVRLVMRATWIYNHYLRASTHPVRLVAREERARMLRLLASPHPGLSAEQSKQVQAQETAALLDLDIPYFSFNDGAGLRANGATTPLTELPCGPSEALRWWWRQACERDVDADARLLAIAWDTAGDDAYDPPFKDARVRRIDAGIRHALRTPDGTQGSWITGVTLGSGTRLAPVPLAFLEGGGVLLETAHRDPATLRDPRGIVAATVRAATWHGVPTDAEIPEVVISPFCGAPADAVTVTELAAAGFPVDAALKQRVAESFTDLATTVGARLARWAPGDPADYLGGLSGALHALALYGRREVAAKTLGSVTRGAHHWDEFARAPESGLAHGTYGRLLGLAALSSLTGAHGPRAAIEAALGRVSDSMSTDPGFVDPQAAGSWCRGHAGAVLALLQIQELLPEIRATEPLARHIEALIESRTADGDISLCHGAAGRILALDTAGRRLGHRAAREAAAAEIRRVNKQIAAGNVRSGLGRAPATEGTLMGVAGWLLVERAVRAPHTTPLILGGTR